MEVSEALQSPQSSGQANAVGAIQTHYRQNHIAAEGCKLPRKWMERAEVGGGGGVTLTRDLFLIFQRREIRLDSIPPLGWIATQGGDSSTVLQEILKFARRSEGLRGARARPYMHGNMEETKGSGLRPEFHWFHH